METQSNATNETMTYYTITAYAAKHGVDRSSVKRWMDRGLIDFIEIVGTDSTLYAIPETSKPPEIRRGRKK